MLRDGSRYCFLQAVEQPDSRHAMPPCAVGSTKMISPSRAGGCRSPDPHSPHINAPEWPWSLALDLISGLSSSLYLLLLALSPPFFFFFFFF